MLSLFAVIGFIVWFKSAVKHPDGWDLFMLVLVCLSIIA